MTDKNNEALTPDEPSFPAALRSNAKFLMDCFDNLSRAEAQVVANKLNEAADALASKSETSTNESDIRRIVSSETADNLGVRRFSEAMQAKLAKKRAQGWGGWNHEPYTIQRDRGEHVERRGCEVSYLRELLSSHILKGDMVDIANLAMMIWNRENPNG